MYDYHGYGVKQAYRKSPKFLDAQNVCCNHPKIQTMRPFHEEICPKGADGMANSVDPDQTAPLGLHCSPTTVCPKIWIITVKVV